MNKLVAQNAFNLLAAKLKDFCEDNTELKVAILTGEYPVKIAFTPMDEDQTSLYENDKSPLTLLVSCGIETQVVIDAKDAVPAATLKKLISLSEKVATAYYHAYREREGTI